MPISFVADHFFMVYFVNVCKEQTAVSQSINLSVDAFLFFSLPLAPSNNGLLMHVNV